MIVRQPSVWNCSEPSMAVMQFVVYFRDHLASGDYYSSTNATPGQWYGLVPECLDYQSRCPVCGVGDVSAIFQGGSGLSGHCHSTGEISFHCHF